MPRFALRIEYDGGPFAGWQAQADLPSVQGTVERALAALDQHRILCAHREGRWGVARWGWMAEDLLRHTVAGYGE